MAGSSSDDELAATAAATSAPLEPVPVLGATLGRYRLERTLGAGGMGVVHAAFDPDLQRRVALKVLRGAHAGDDARERLLREARAMARLTHPNVVAVYEVGSAAGRDYVAMELVDGETLDRWLAAQPRTRREIIAAFLAAGRGLAAAHAAGLVHRDFKPHNVLRRRDGRIAVTDFGLARGVEVAPAAGDAGAAPAQLTATGAVMGTPAYMAPEQWAGGAVGPAADQFAFCVALWEALAGRRPFHADQLDELQRAVERGSAALDPSPLPRALRRPLLRGLADRPELRWPSTDALLAELARADRRRGAALPIAAAIAGAAVVGYAVVPRGAAAPGCEPPAIDPAAVWPDGAALAGHRDVAALFTRDIAAWRTQRARACELPIEQRIARLGCLDGVLARLDALRRAAGALPVTSDGDAVARWLVDPAVCDVARPPHLTLRATPAVIAGFAHALAGDPVPDPAIAAEPDPCARVVLYATSRANLAALDASAEACTDDRLRADALIAGLGGPVLGPSGEAAVRRLATAIPPVAQPDLVAELDLASAAVAGDHRAWDDAFAATARAIAGFGARGRTRGQLAAVVEANRLRLMRSRLADLEDVRAAVARWLPRAAALHDPELAHALAGADGLARWLEGDVAGGHAELVDAWTPEPPAGGIGHGIDGIVIGADGRPAAGAVVALGRRLIFDALGPLPVPHGTAELRIATTDADGLFAIADGPAAGAIVAQLGDLRSPAVAIAPDVRLQLAATRRVEGTAELAGPDRGGAFVMAWTDGDRQRVQLWAPIAPGGAFAIAGAPTARIGLGIATPGSDGGDLGSIEAVTRPAGTGDVRGIALHLPSGERSIDVVARAPTPAAFETAQVVLLPGRLAIATTRDLDAQVHGDARKQPFAPPHDKRALEGVLRPGDLVAHFGSVGPGDFTACVVGLDEPAVKCAWVAPEGRLLVIEAPAPR